MSSVGTQEGKNSCHLGSSDCSHCLREPRGSWTLAPDIWGTHQRKDFSEPRLLHLPIYRKALNSLTWDIWFSFTIIFYALYGQTTWLLLLPPRNYSLRVTWDTVCWAWSPKHSCQIKLSTEKYSHNLKVESYFIWWECLGLQAQETASQ